METVLEFKPIDFERHSDTCVQFMKDGYRSAFGDADRLEHEADGKGVEEYLHFLKKYMDDDPRSCVHVWSGDRIVGQIELGKFRHDPARGYVYFVYLIDELRGRGFSNQLEDYIETYFRKLGIPSIMVSVARKNVRAVRFYEKYGWKYHSSRKDIPELDYMIKDLAPAVQHL